MMTQPGFDQQTFHTLLEGHLSHVNRGDALQKIRSRAWDQFLEMGLPTKRTEAYRYIKLRDLFSRPYGLAEEQTVDFPSYQEAIYPECCESYLIFVNGHYQPSLSNLKGLPSKVVVTPLHDAIKTYGAFLNNFWAKAIKEETDPFVTLNTALHRNGAFIYVPPKTHVEKPIQILHVITEEIDPSLILPRVHLFVGAHSQVDVLTSQIANQTTSPLVNGVVEMALEENAHVYYTQVLLPEFSQGWHFTATRASLKREATLKCVEVTEGSLTVRSDYRVALTGENSEALLNGVWMLSGRKESHTHVFIDHQAPYCRSYQLFKGVVNDTARSSFEGKIMVRQAAQKTEAFQLNNNLLLSEGAQANSKPNLEIFADDVKASHGSTVGQLDQEELFYMKTRGLLDHEAKSLLVYGFCEQVLEMVKLESLRNQLNDHVKRYLTLE